LTRPGWPFFRHPGAAYLLCRRHRHRGPPARPRKAQFSLAVVRHLASSCRSSPARRRARGHRAHAQRCAPGRLQTQDRRLDLQSPTPSVDFSGRAAAGQLPAVGSTIERRETRHHRRAGPTAIAFQIGAAFRRAADGMPVRHHDSRAGEPAPRTRCADRAWGGAHRGHRLRGCGAMSRRSLNWPEPRSRPSMAAPTPGRPDPQHRQLRTAGSAGFLDGTDADGTRLELQAGTHADHAR